MLVDYYGRAGVRRYSVSAYPANKGGVWICYVTTYGTVKIVYAPSTTTRTADLGPSIEFAGYTAAVTVDSKGDLHVVYSNGGIKYRKIEITGDSKGGSGINTVAGNFDAAGGHDLAVWDSATGKWYIKPLKGKVIAKGSNWGFPGAIPLAGKFAGADADDLGIYDPTTGKWYIKPLKGKVIANGLNWGFSGAIPVPGNYGGGNEADLAVYEPQRAIGTSRSLRARRWRSGQLGIPWRGAGAQDYNGDGVWELAVYDPATGNWYIKPINGKVLRMV